MRGKTMAQTMDAAAVGQARLFQSRVKQLLRAAVDHRSAGIAARGKQPRARTAARVITAQFLQQPRAEDRVAVLRPLALLDAQQHPAALDVGDLQMAGFVEAQARAIHRQQKRAHPPVMAGGKEPRQLLAAVNPRPAPLRARSWQVFVQPLDAPSQHPGIEEPQPAHRDIDRAERAPLPVENQQIVANLRPGDGIRRPPVMPCKTRDRGDVRLDGAFRVTS